MTDSTYHINRKYTTALTEAFGAWERRCRGWAVWDFAVELEPAFNPIRPTRQILLPVNDDARIGSSKNSVRSHIPLTVSIPRSFYRTESISELQILPPRDFDITPALAGQFLLSLGSCRTPVAFELVADSQKIEMQMACDEGSQGLLKSNLTTFFPTVSVHERKGKLSSHFTNPAKTVIADFGLARSFILPLAIFRAFDPDPTTGLISSLNTLEGREKAVVQILFQKTRNCWTEELRRVVSDRLLTTALALNNQSIREKLSSPFFAVLLRILVQATTTENGWRILRMIGSNLAPFADSSGNELIALSNDLLAANNHFLSVLNRTTYRSGMLLNAGELASLIHPPSGTVMADKLTRSPANTKAVPAIARNGTLFLGINRHHGKTERVTLSTEQRLKHMHIIGATGSGKSTTLIRMMAQDAELGHGFAAFDPHGDLIDNLLERIPENRLNDVILFDPADEDYPIGFNVLSAHSELEKTLLSSDLVSIFRRFSTSWGDVMNSVLANTVLAFLESSRAGSLIDLKRFLVDKDFREDFLKTIEDKEIHYYWKNEFTQLRGKPYDPLLTRLDTFLRSKLVRNIVAQKENRLDFRRIMDERKILLVRLSHGAMGMENSYLLGSLIVSKIHLAALSRQNLIESMRQPFFLYLDEAHNFLTETLNHVITGGRKFALGIVATHQNLHQFQSGETGILSSILSNCFTRICFRVDDTDAERLAKGFSFFTPAHLKNLGVGEAVCRFEQSRYDFNLETRPLETVSTVIAGRRCSVILNRTRSMYAKPKADVENESLDHRQGFVPTETEPLSALSDQTASVGKSEVAQKGRGGAYHIEIQQIVKRMAERYGFDAEIEKSVLNGTGSVDISIENDGLKIACEVSVTTTDYEASNVRKCLSAGYDHVLVVVSNKKKIPLINAKLDSAIPIGQRHKIRTFGLADMHGFLRKLSGHDEPKRKSGNHSQPMNFAEACDFLNVGASTLYRWIREGRVPFYRPGREYQFDRDKLILIGKHDLSAKRKPFVELQPLKIDKTTSKTKKKQDARYRKMLKLD